MNQLGDEEMMQIVAQIGGEEAIRNMTLQDFENLAAAMSEPIPAEAGDHARSFLMAVRCYQAGKKAQSQEQ